MVLSFNPISDAAISDIADKSIIPPVFPPVVAFTKFHHQQPENSLRYYVNRRKAEQASGPIWVQLPYKPTFLHRPIETPVSRWYLTQGDIRRHAVPRDPTVKFDMLVIETLVAVNPPTLFDNVLEEVLVKVNPGTIFDGVMEEVLLKNNPPINFDTIVSEGLIAGPLPPEPGPIPTFPAVPYGLPIKMRPKMFTTISDLKSGREVRFPNQTIAAIWEFEILFEVLRDQTQNQQPYTPLAAFTEYMQIVQHWLSMYGQYGMFNFDAPWDDSRENQTIGIGNGEDYYFTIVRTWGFGSNEITEPIGNINEVFSVTIGGLPVDSSRYIIDSNQITFIYSDTGLPHPPDPGQRIAMSFSFYYLCRFQDDSQDFSEFFKNINEVKSLKFEAPYYPPGKRDAL